MIRAFGILIVTVLIFSSAIAAEVRVPNHAPEIGNSRGSIQIIEFFDYRCGYCKKMVPVLDKVRKNHRDVNIVFIEYPIFGGESQLMAKSAMAVKTIKSSKYFDYHKALMNHRGKFTADTVVKLANNIGVNGEKVLKEMQKSKYDSYLKDNAMLAKKFQVKGTPHVVVDGKSARGFVSYKKLDKYLRDL